MAGEEVLNEFIRLGGVVASLIVDAEGNVLTQVVGDFPAQALKDIGLLASRGLKSAEMMGQELTKGVVTHSVIEYIDNVIAMEFISENKILVIVAVKGANLGRIRYEVRKRKKDLASVV